MATDTCVEFSVERWFPVANLTKVLPVKVYEYYSPGTYVKKKERKEVKMIYAFFLSLTNGL